MLYYVHKDLLFYDICFSMNVYTHVCTNIFTLSYEMMLIIQWKQNKVSYTYYILVCACIIHT